MNIKKKSNVILLALTTLIMTIIGCDENKAEIKSIDGEYSFVSSLEKNSKAKVKLDVFINFSCSHCYNSHKRMQTLQKKYGKRLAGIFRPLIKKGTNDSILRLFHIARKENKEALAIESFYHAKFKENLDLSEPEVIVNIAEKLGLTNEYHKMRDSTWVDRAINFDVLLASNYKIYSTPTWIIEKQLKIKTNFNNLEVVINSLLLK